MADKNLAFPRNLLKRFIQLYKESPCLWNRKCIAYKHKQKRHEAISRLTELIHEYDPSATNVHVLRKIESMRACVRREHKKVQTSILNAKSDDEVYVPHLWYYESLSFLFEETESSKMKIEVEDEDESDNGDTTEDTGQHFEPAPEVFPEYAIACNVMQIVPDSRTDKEVQKQYEDDGKRKQHCTEVDDEYDAIGINVAAKLRGLPSNMRILAEKLINDVLYQAQTNTLTTSTVITTPDPFK